MLANTRQQAAEIEAALDAAEKGDETGIQDAINERQELESAGHRLAGELGLRGCAGKLPVDQEEEVRALITDAFVEGSANICREHATPDFIESGFDGSAEKCEAEVRTAEEAAESLDIRSITGVPDAAQVEFDLHGGALDGVNVELYLDRFDGVWKVITSVQE